MHLVIIGGVAAGTKAAARARRTNRDLAITLFQDESEVSYTACGQPYYLSGVVDKRESLIIRKAENFEKEGISVRLRHRVIRIDPDDSTVQVHTLANGRISSVHYDRLILATGARAVVPPIPGNHLDGVVTLRSMAELDRFRSVLERLTPQQAVIAGGGYIALEVAESLHALGIETTLIMRNRQIFSRLDPEMSQFIEFHLLTKGIRIVAESNISEIVGRGGRVSEVVAQNHTMPAQMVVLALGAKSNVEIAEQAGIVLGPTGAIAVDERMETSIKGIFAAGDCAESYHRLTRQPVWTPLGDIANLQGRVAGENAAGGHAIFPGVFGTSIFKSFEIQAGMTGLTEADAKNAGFTVVSAMITARDKARYYPGARDVTLKLVADATNGRLLGAQVVGSGSVDKITDIAATALLGNLTCSDLENADLAYAPPFSPVLSPIIVAAGALSKKLAMPDH
ncbi:MAG: FAD-dependent oxidoreductase [Gammaproteobacteria bacterium]